MAKKLVIVAMGAVGVIALAACSSSGGSGTSGSSTSSSGGSAATGTPIALSAFGVLQSAALSFPELQAGAEAALKSINASGGVKGHPLTLDFCNDQGDPTQSAQCARKIVASKAVANVASLTFGAAQAVPILQAGSVANIAPEAIAPIEYTNPDVFLIDPGAFGVYYAEPPLAVKEAAAKTAIALYTESPATANNIKIFSSAAQSAGITIVKSITIPANTADFSPYVNQVKQSGADAVIGTLSSTDQLKYWKAAQSLGLKIPSFNTDGAITQDVIDASQGAADGTYLTSQFPDPRSDSKTPGISEFRADMSKYESGQALSAVSLRAWAGVQLFKIVASQINGDITREAVVKALNAVHDLHFYWISSLSFDQPGPFADYPRIVSPVVYGLKIENGKVVDLNAKVTISPN